jgi:hypothetical protein
MRCLSNDGAPAIAGNNQVRANLSRTIRSLDSYPADPVAVANQVNCFMLQVKLKIGKLPCLFREELQEVPLWH